ncbi:MAG: T9SS type A sorting domain-containing protein [Roseivirga sp.]|nr:T9SS type A sorting domain-containing protein [Roseivirga sp.]
MDSQSIKQSFRNNLWISLLGALLISSLTSKAQSIKPSVFSSAGSSLDGTSNSLVLTVGEGVVATLQNSNVKLYMGFIMPIGNVISAPQMSSRSSSDLLNGIRLDEEIVLIYPNPVKRGELLHIRGAMLMPESVNLKVTNANGQNLDSDRLNAMFNDASMELELKLHLPSGFYLLHVPVREGFVSKKLIVK